MKNKSSIDEVIADRDPITLLNRLLIAIKIAFLFFRELGIDKRTQQIHRLAILRQENFSQTCCHLVQSSLNLLPSNADRLDFAGKKDIISSVKTEKPVVLEIKTKDNHTFYDWEGSKKQFSTYWLLRDKSRKFYTPVTFSAASAVYRSFTKGDSRFPADRFLPRDGGVIVEAGAYVGYKAIKFARRVGPAGRVVAVELDPANYRLLCRNVEANHLETVIGCVQCAVWNEDALLPMRGQSRMSNTVVDVDKLDFPYRDDVVAKCLDTIIDEQELDQIDFLNLQLNGAEIEALEGLRKNWSKVKYINIVTRYARDGLLVVDIARQMLERRGARVVIDARCERLHNLCAELR